MQETDRRRAIQRKGQNAAARRHSAKPTAKQVDYLLALGYTGPLDLTKTEVSDAITLLQNRRNKQTVH